MSVDTDIAFRLKGLVDALESALETAERDAEKIEIEITSISGHVQRLRTRRPNAELLVAEYRRDPASPLIGHLLFGSGKEAS